METTTPPKKEDLLGEIGAPRPRGLRRALRFAALGVALVGLAAGGWIWHARSAAGPAPRYLTTRVERGDLAATVTATGTLRGKDTVSVGAETSGRVKAVRVDFNDRVTAGQVLAEIDPEQIDANLRQASAQLQAARADVRNRQASAVEARLAAERTRSLAADGLISRQQLEAAEAAAERAVSATEAARAQVAVAAANVASTRTAREKTQVRSPQDGVVLSRDVEVGQTLVAAMQTPVIFKIARDLREMELTIAIDEADVGRTRAGQNAHFTVDAWPGRRFPGALFSIHNVAVTKDSVVTYEALLRVQNDDLLLRPGMTATVTIATDERAGVLLVPNAALRFSPPSTVKRTMMDGPPGEGGGPIADGRSRVYRLREGKPEAVVVEVGLTDGVRTEVVPVAGETLVEGETVVTDLLSQGAAASSDPGGATSGAPPATGPKS